MKQGTDYIVEPAKSGRARCRACGLLILKGSIRIGITTYVPHETTRWVHVHHIHDGSPEVNVHARPKLRVALRNAIEAQLLSDEDDIAFIKKAESFAPIKSLNPIGPKLDISIVAGGLTSMYKNFRSFRFNMPSDLMYTDLWNWRCLLATMLVCNTSEKSMLSFITELFLEFPEPNDLVLLRDDKSEQEKWIDIMTAHKVKHAKKKLFFIINATRLILEKFDGKIPSQRSELESIPGVGRHVSSVVMAWVHEKGEFGVDLHVRRILTRLGLIDADFSEIEIEELVKDKIHEDKIGHLSRAFVDHGQAGICGYSPDCTSCIFKHGCPSAAQFLEW